MARRPSLLALCALITGALFAAAGHALVVSKPEVTAKSTRNGLAGRQMAVAELTVVADTESMETARPFVDKALNNRVENFKLLAGDERWNAEVDKRTGMVTYVEGAGLPWIPGRGNQLGNATL